MINNIVAGISHVQNVTKPVKVRVSLLTISKIFLHL